MRRNGPVGVQSDKPASVGSPGMNPRDPRHIPVLGREAVQMLKPGDGGLYVDATFGAGGYSRAILESPAQG